MRATSIIGIERSNSEPLDGPGSDVGTTLMSSRPLPLPGKVLWDRVGEGFVGDGRRGDFRPGREFNGTEISSRGRFGVDPRDCSPEDQRSLSGVGVSVSHGSLGAFEDDAEGEGVGSAISGS